MIDFNSTFFDMICPKCGHTAGNSGHGDSVSCPNCGWSEKIVLSSEDAAMIEHFLQEHQKRNGRNEHESE